MSELEAGRLRLYADLGPDGAPRALYLDAAAGELRLRREPDEGRPPLRLPAGAVAAVCARYGRPLADESRAAVLATMSAPLEIAGRAPGEGGGRLRAFVFRPHGYLQPLDYLLWEPAGGDQGGEALALPAPLCCSALEFLAHRAARANDDGDDDGDDDTAGADAAQAPRRSTR